MRQADTAACGTIGGYKRHHRTRPPTPPCEPCLAAKRAQSNDAFAALKLLGAEYPQRTAELSRTLAEAGVLPAPRWTAARRMLAREHRDRYREIHERIRAARAAGRPGEVG